VEVIHGATRTAAEDVHACTVNDAHVAVTWDGHGSLGLHHHPRSLVEIEDVYVVQVPRAVMPPEQVHVVLVHYARRPVARPAIDWCIKQSTVHLSATKNSQPTNQSALPSTRENASSTPPQMVCGPEQKGGKQKEVTESLEITSGVRSGGVHPKSYPDLN
jgi:hypothetical protein